MSSLLATTHAIYAAFGSGNSPGVLEHLDDDVAWESWSDNSSQLAGVPWMTARQGKDGAAEFFRFLGTQTEVRELTLLSFSVGEHTVAVEFETEVHYPATGRTLRDQEMHLWTFNDAGKVIRLRHYTDTAKHQWAAGLT